MKTAERWEKRLARDIIAMIHVMLSQKPVINMMFGGSAVPE